MTDHDSNKGAMSSNKLIGIIRIADFDASQSDRFETIIRQEDFQLIDIKPFSCCIWMRRACSRLRDEGIMHIDDWAEVRRELPDFSNEYWLSSSNDKQPRPLGYSKVCGLKY